MPNIDTCTHHTPPFPFLLVLKQDADVHADWKSTPSSTTTVFSMKFSSFMKCDFKERRTLTTFFFKQSAKHSHNDLRFRRTPSRAQAAADKQRVDFAPLGVKEFRLTGQVCVSGGMRRGGLYPKIFSQSGSIGTGHTGPSPLHTGGDQWVSQFPFVSSSHLALHSNSHSTVPISANVSPSPIEVETHTEEVCVPEFDVCSEDGPVEDVFQ
ncbi:hypothetical protein Aperf_G00000111164 [Anoplocephala perfoliata]